MIAEPKVATSDRKNFPEIQYPTHHSPNKVAHESAELIQRLDYTSVSDSSQIINSTTSASPLGYQLSAMMSTLDATAKEKKSHPMYDNSI